MTRPEGSNVEVILKLKFENGNYTETKEYVVKILKRSSQTGGGGGGGYSGGKSQNIVVSPVKDNTKMPERKDMFIDLSEAVWAKEKIERLAEDKIVNGNEDGRFEPNRNISREEFVKIVLAALNVDVSDAECSFDDAVKDSWYYKYVAKAYEMGIVNGIGENCFGIGEQIKRCDMTVILDRAFKIREVETENLTFTDKNDIPGYAEKSVAKLCAMGLINGFEDKTFRPNDAATRAQAAAVIYNYLYLEK